MSFDMDGYNDVPSRIAEFRAKHPEGSLQQVSCGFHQVDGQWGVMYLAAAYRTPEDIRPGHGTAWEPFPGKTPYTRGSEVQNAETSAWGRAIVACLAADTRKGIATAEDVRNRQEDQRQVTSAPPAPAEQSPLQIAKTRAWRALAALHPSWDNPRTVAEIEDAMRERFAPLTLAEANTGHWNLLAEQWEKEKAS